MSKIEDSWRLSVGRRRALASLAALFAGSPLLRAQQDTPLLKDHRRFPGLSEMETAFDFEPIFRAKLSQATYDYTAFGSDGEFTLRRNREAFDWVDIVKRPGTAVATVDTSTEIFGIKMRFPILVAPSDGQALLHPEGEVGMHVGATAANITHIVVGGAFEKVAQSAKGHAWYQHYPREQVEGRTEALVRAQATGCETVVVTVDIRGLYFERAAHDKHVGGWQSTSKRFDNPYRITDSWGWLDWTYFDQIRPIVKVPLLVKGILTAEDARMAIERGMDGIVVSNHGGRACDYGPSTLEVLPEIVEAVNGRVPVFVDSGFRRGSDIFKALALGARGVLLGRASRWGLGAYGPSGVQRVLELLQAELVETMKSAGRPTLAAIDRTAVRTRFL